jgi:hypothetical protein
MIRLKASAFAFLILQSAYSLLPAAIISAQTLSPSQSLSPEQRAAFLGSATIVNAVPIGKGVTKPFRLTLSDGRITHDAAFQSVDREKPISQHTGRDGKLEFKFVDSWRFNIAAYRLAAMLGIGEMVPVSVERSWEGKRGALTWWVDDVLMDEQERQDRGAESPDRDKWFRQQLRMRVFTQLVHDTDRNRGNTLYTTEWDLVMIDFSRAFRRWNKPPDPLATLPRCDRKLLAAMRALTKDSVRTVMGPYLTTWEVESLLARRDVLVNHFDRLIAARGEENVLY